MPLSNQVYFDIWQLDTASVRHSLMTDHQRHDDPVRDHAVFSDRVALFSKPSMGSVRCMQD